MALSFSEGSIGGDIEEIDMKQLEAFYAKGAKLPLMPPVLMSSGAGVEADKGFDRSRKARTASPSRRLTKPAATRC
jgi:hypothetical protein